MNTNEFYRDAYDLRRRAIIYVRVSTARVDMVSPEQQDKVCRDFARTHGFVIVGDTIEDIDISGRSFDKRQVATLIERVRNGEFGTILVWQYSRWARNAGMGIAQIKILEQAGGQLIAVTEAADTRTASGILQRGIHLQFAEHLSNIMSESWRMTHKRRLEAGLPINGRVRFGYSRCPDCRRREDKPEAYLHCKTCEGVLVIDPLRGSFLVECYERYLKGKAFTYLTTQSREKGIRSTQGRLLTDKTLGGIMDSGFGAGLLCVDPRQRIEGKFLNPDIREYQWFPGVHEPLIDDLTWKNYFDRRTDNKKINPVRLYGKNAMSGLFRCSLKLPDGEVCHGPLVVNHKEDGMLYYRCGNAIEYKVCKASQVASSTLEAFVKEWVASQAIDTGLALTAMKAAAKRKEMQATIDTLVSAKRLAEERLKRLNDIHLAGDVDRNYFLDKKAEIEGEISALETQIKEAGGIRDAQVPAPKEFQGLLGVWDDLTPDEMNTALKKIIAYGLFQGGGRPGKNRKPLEMSIVPRWEASPIHHQKHNPANPQSKSDTQPGQ